MGNQYDHIQDESMPSKKPTFRFFSHLYYITET